MIVCKQSSSFLIPHCWSTPLARFGKQVSRYNLSYSLLPSANVSMLITWMLIPFVLLFYYYFFLFIQSNFRTQKIKKIEIKMEIPQNQTQKKTDENITSFTKVIFGSITNINVTITARKPYNLLICVIFSWKCSFNFK